MAIFAVDHVTLAEEEGLYTPDGGTQSFFYFRYFDVVSDIFLDAVGVGPVARAERNLSTYNATADVTILKPLMRGEPARFECDVVRIGAKSFGYQCRMLNVADGTVCATYDAISVTMDMTDAPTPIVIPDETRACLQKYERDAA